MAGALWRLGIEKIPGIQSEPEPCGAWAWIMWTFSIITVPDTATPLQETMATLDLLVRQGKALYIGLSNYPAELARQAFKILRELGTPCLIHQPKYSMFERWVEPELLDVLADSGVGSIAFSPLAGGLLTDRYLEGIPEDSRVATGSHFLTKERLDTRTMDKVRRLNAIALSPGTKIVANGAGLDIARRSGDVGIGRRQQTGTDR